jgi:hypothetical protein
MVAEQRIQNRLKEEWLPNAEIFNEDSYRVQNRGLPTMNVFLHTPYPYLALGRPFAFSDLIWSWQLVLHIWSARTRLHVQSLFISDWLLLISNDHTFFATRVLSYGMDYQLVHKQEIAPALCCAIQVQFLRLNTQQRPNSKFIPRFNF